MSDKLAIRGKITVELIRKNGKREITEENFLTNFGKQFAMANGLNRLMFTDNTVPLSRLEYLGGPFGTPSATTRKTGLAVMSNVLLNLARNVTEADSLFACRSGELVAYAYQPTTPAGSVGSLVDLGSNSGMGNNIKRRYQYDTQLAATITHIGIMTTTPDGANGRVYPTMRSISPYNYSNTALINKFLPGYACGLGTKKLCVNPGGTGIVVDAETGVVSDTGYVDGPAPTSGSYNFVWFKWGNYVYKLYQDSDKRFVKANIYDATTGSLVSSNVSYGTTWMSGNKVCMRYFPDTGKLYLIRKYSSETTCYRHEFTLDASGKLVYNSTETAGEDTDFIENAIPASDGTTYYHVANTKVYDAYGNLIGFLVNSVYQNNDAFYNTDFFLLDGQLSSLYTFGNDKLLQTYGNLISMHPFSTPIVKNAGDALYVTYEYMAT